VVDSSHPASRVARSFRIQGTLKSCKRYFDTCCLECDKISSLSARNEWRELVSSGPVALQAAWCHDPSWLLKKRIRELVAGWGRRLAACRESGEGPLGPHVYVPDQQGCFETPRKSGGTLGTHPADYSPDDSLLRVGVAKTKGKHRVVTMQSARVKRVLTPVHNALYDHISSFGWCVRGDVSQEDFRAVVADRRSGESYISGDYSAATDNIYLPAVNAMVEVLAEDPELEEEERSVLLGSFRDLRWKARSGKEYPILRGSMMGNLVSFPLLCLLNKACFDISCDIFHGPGSHRVVRINGDDCAFAGSDDFFRFWKVVTSTFGFVVNVDKTGVSTRWIELNSRCFDARNSRFVSKPVLSFLRPERNNPDCILANIIEGVSTFRPEVRLWIVCDLMRYEISLREIDIAAVPPRWIKILLKRRWFRCLLAREPPPLRERGVERTVPTVVGLPPRESAYAVISTISAEIMAEHVRFWRGKKVEPRERRIFRTGKAGWEGVRPLRRWYAIKFGWRFVWPSLLYEIVSEEFPELLLEEWEASSLVIPDHPFIQCHQWLDAERPKRSTQNYSAVPPPRSLRVGRVCGGGAWL
jgi:hypothetical protein